MYLIRELTDKNKCVLERTHVCLCAYLFAFFYKCAQKSVLLLDFGFLLVQSGIKSVQ